MSECCSDKLPVSSGATLMSNDPSMPRCQECGAEGRPVERKTILHHLNPEHLDRVNAEAFNFCPNPICAIVYFSQSGTRFAVDDLRELVSTKITGDIRPICYCFGFTEGNARKEIARTGKSTITATVSGLIKAGMCACEVRNPSGNCCLGEVNRTVMRLLNEHETSMNEATAPEDNCCAQ